MAQDKVSGPRSSTGIVQFADAATGGPQMDPRAVVIFSVLFIFMIKLVSLMMVGA